MTTVLTEQGTLNTQNLGGPLQRYQQALDSGHFQTDEAQARAVALLDDIYRALIARKQQQHRFLARFRMPPAPRGLYMWGGVGRGKTWLMDQFYDSLPFTQKIRLHFHHFMQEVHRQLNELRGQVNPLDKVADTICSKALVICFDEFFVRNVADAMILGHLFTLLFKRGITLVTTSNIPPEKLYENGIQREQFLPAIAVLQQHCVILNVDVGVDYRLRVLRQADLYRSPLNAEAQTWLAERFKALTFHHAANTEPLTIQGRVVEVVQKVDDVAWFKFSELCEKPRSAADFIEIAGLFSTVLVQDIPSLNDEISGDVTRRFIYLVDEFYDQRVKLLITAQQPILELYSGQKMAFEIQRTRSRLLEMQSDDYLQQAHRQA